MKRALVLVLVAAAVAAGYYAGQFREHDAPPAAAVAVAERRVLYWHDPMVPLQKFDKPGKSPFMSMDLVPVYADEKGNENGVAVSARMRQSLGIRTATAEVTELRQDLMAVGYVQADERRMARAGIEYFEHSTGERK